MKTYLTRTSRLAAAVVAGSLALTACGSSSGGTSGNSSPKSQDATFATGFVGSTTSAGTPKQGGTLTIADYGEPRSLNPTVTYANGATGGSAMSAVYDELVRYDYKTNTFVPELAQSLTSSNNNTVWTLKLRPGTKFTDGTPLNSAAVVGSLKYYEANYAYQSNLMLANVAKTTTPDANTVVFTLRNPWSAFPNMLAQGPGMIMAPAAYANPKAFKPIGAGPFMFGSYAPGESLVLNANPNYVNGRPYLNSLKFIWLGGTADQPKVDALNAGTADVAYVRDPAVASTARANGMQGFMFSSGMNDVLSINTRAGHPGSDPIVRQAINYAINANTYVQRVNNGAAIATKAMFGSASPWYSPTPEAYDQAKAKELVQQAKAKGFNGNLSYAYSASPSAQAGAVLIQAMLNAVGFNVTLMPLRSIADQVQTMYVTHNFDIAVSSVTLSDVDPYGRLASEYGAQSPSNVSGWSSPQMNQLLAQLEAKDTPDQGKAVMAQIQAMLATEVPEVSLDAAGVFYIWAKDVHGIEPTTETLTLFTKAWKG